MAIFLKFLIYSLQTTDGIKGTADKLIEEINRDSIKDLKAQTGQVILDKANKYRIIQKNEEYVYEKIHMKYKIL